MPVRVSGGAIVYPSPADPIQGVNERVTRLIFFWIINGLPHGSMEVEIPADGLPPG